MQKLISHYKRGIIYTIILLLVALGHSFLLQISLESFRYFRHTLMSMVCLLCLYGAFMLIMQKKESRADKLFAFLLFMVGLTNLFSLIRGWTTGYAGVVKYTFMSFSMLIYGSTYAYIFLLYPLEAFRPGWLTLRRSFYLFLPTLVILFIYILQVRILKIANPDFSNWSDLMREPWNLNVWLRLVILFYPILGVILMLRYRNNYIEWCENNFASMEQIDVKWLGDYIFGNFVITLSCEVVIFSNDVRSVLMHNIIIFIFLLYGFYRVLFWKSPYPEGYFKEGLDDAHAQIREIMQSESRGNQIDKVKNEESLRDVLKFEKSPITDKLPEYKSKLEIWMETDKPYLRRDFKLTDAMEILPLNRSYLSRLFNEGYGENFYQFVMRYRLEESKRLLLTRPDLTITHIATMSGFSSPSVFGRAFTQKMNCSPLQWREKESKVKMD
jgi:AraC-like DNA-binding protein